MPLDGLRLECDGMTRVVSTLLARECVAHQGCVGRLEIDGVGSIGLHWWVELPDGSICDLRARMWLGDGPAVPHGAFKAGQGVRYLVGARRQVALPPEIFEVLAGQSLDSYPALTRGDPP